MSMIVGIIAENNINAVMEKVEANPNVDIFEWRLDYLSAIDIDAIKAIKEIINKPLIFTLRPKNQGGHYEDSEEKRIALLKKLSLLLPEYMDIEYTVAYNIITTIKKQCSSADKKLDFGVENQGNSSKNKIILLFTGNVSMCLRNKVKASNQ